MATKARPPIVMFRTGDAAAGALRAYRRESARWPYHAARMHGHRFFVLNYFDRGDGQLRLPGRTVRVRPGHVFLAAPGALHDTSGVASMGGWVVEFTPELLARAEGASPLLVARSDGSWLMIAGRRLGRPGFAEVPATDRASWGERLQKLALEAGTARLGSIEAIRALLELLLIDLARLLVPDARAAAAAPPLLHEVFKVIDRNFAEPGVSLSAVARAVGRSPSHVTALVRRQTGMTVLEWLTERRMAEARRRLRDTDEDVSIVAERVGYLDPAYFARLFRREHGVSPRAFRRAQQ
jgi:AraC-like DNA-binding protein